MRERVRARAVGRKERSFDMRPEDPRPLRARRHRAQSLDRRLLRRSDEGGLVRGHAGEQQCLARAAVVVARGGEEVDPAVAVHLKVDEAGNRDPAARPTGETERDDAPVLDVDVAGDELPANQCSLDAEPHWPAAFRTEPSDASSLERAASASTPASSETSATRASPAAAASASSTRSSEAPLASTTLRRARSRSLSFAGATPTIKPPYVRPSRIIVTVEIVLRTSFCAVPAFSRVEPAITSGPTTTATSSSARAAARLPRALATATPSAPHSRATSSAARTNGVEPLALTATTQSSGRRASPCSAFAAAARSSSSASCSATTARTSPGGEPNVEL